LSRIAIAAAGLLRRVAKKKRVVAAIGFGAIEAEDPLGSTHLAVPPVAA
jgi:hypothetical protein